MSIRWPACFFPCLSWPRFHRAVKQHEHQLDGPFFLVCKAREQHEDQLADLFFPSAQSAGSSRPV